MDVDALVTTLAGIGDDDMLQNDDPSVPYHYHEAGRECDVDHHLVKPFSPIDISLKLSAQTPPKMIWWKQLTDGDGGDDDDDGTSSHIFLER